jgi:hypothetical protein
VTKENRDKTVRLTGKLICIGASLKDAYSDVLISDTRTRDLIIVAQAAVEKAVISAWEKADSEAVEG